MIEVLLYIKLLWRYLQFISMISYKRINFLDDELTQIFIYSLKLFYIRKYINNNLYFQIEYQSFR